METDINDYCPDVAFQGHEERRDKYLPVAAAHATERHSEGAVCSTVIPMTGSFPLVLSVTVENISN